MEIAIDHVNVTVPIGATEQVCAFYVAAFGFTRVEKPPGGRHAGAWLQVDTSTQLHLSEHTTAPNRQSHFAIRVSDYGAIMDEVARLGVETEVLADRGSRRRVLVRDPAGNGIEVCETA